MSDLQREIIDGLRYMQAMVEEGRYGDFEEVEQAAFEEDLNEHVLDKFEE